ISIPSTPDEPLFFLTVSYALFRFVGDITVFSMSSVKARFLASSEKKFDSSGSPPVFLILFGEPWRKDTSCFGNNLSCSPFTSCPFFFSDYAIKSRKL
ncbi:MAG: hypothetical protein AB8G86_27190, partial [Saprospiraceae bacterium]